MKDKIMLYSIIFIGILGVAVPFFFIAIASKKPSSDNMIVLNQYVSEVEMFIMNYSLSNKDITELKIDMIEKNMDSVVHCESYTYVESKLKLKNCQFNNKNYCYDNDEFKIC